MALDDDASPAPRDTYEALLLGYAFGVLDQAQSLIVASHLTLSPRARALTRACEDMAGTLLEKDCEPVPMSSGALRHIMTAIESAPCCEDKSACAGRKNPHLPEELDLPGPLLSGPMQSCTDFRWKSMAKGFQGYDLALERCPSKARLMKLQPGLKTPQHRHEGLEITLILGGAVIEDGSLYRRGDLLVADETLTHSPQACPQAGCVCMVVTSAPVKLTGLLSILNPFLKF